MFSSKLFNISLTKIKTDTGRVIERFVIEPLSKSVAGVVVKNGKVVLVKTRRMFWEDKFWEFPGGWMKDGEIALSAIRRKVEEETGFEVKTIERLGNTLGDLGTSTKQMLYFYVEVGDRILSFNQELVEKVGTFTVDQVKSLINQGEIVDERTLTALMLAKNKELL